MNPIGVYFHIPFCVHKCAYCDFYSLVSSATSGYAEAVVRQIKAHKNDFKGRFVDTVYIGGGTPTILPPEDITKILDGLRAFTDVATDAEITIEANPGTLDGARLSAYRRAGVNRLSIGLQSADDEELFMLSRIHTAEDFENSFLLARMEGFDNINIDIMYALPHQTIGKLTKTLSYIAEMNPEHVSFYGLKIEENTPFGRFPNIERTLPDEETQVRMYINSCKFLESRGLKQYEISNFAKAGKECRHNLKYWMSNDYIGFGPAAHSMIGGRMFSYKRDFLAYLAHSAEDAPIIDEDYTMTLKEMAVQYVMLALRLTKGVSKSEYASRFGMDFDKKYLDKIKPFMHKKLIVENEDGYHLSRRGMLISNLILSEILDFDEK